MYEGGGVMVSLWLCGERMGGGCVMMCGREAVW